ncbi:alpha/beta hydrolase [Curtobacterium sp. ER1/6]|uniref:alpha/beta hydrolase n=1 Tax=Curtobacterium sp. ER1/6 TaxID=1891920 RepID=UPI0009F6C7F6|nr:alpha/beta hydrolase fold domain-containing protein [Curtobacterium sp. ER1/6]
MISADPERPGSLRWYAASAPPAPPTLLWLHGGGFFRGGLDTPEADAVAQALSSRGVSVATTSYRLAPLPGLGTIHSAGRRRGQFPLALHDITAAYHEVRASSVGDVFIGGASAGACLAAAAALRAADEGLRAAGAILAYGFFHSIHPPTRDAHHRSRRHRRLTHAVWGLNLMNRNYAGSSDALAHRLAFPGGHDLAGFPRTLMVNAEHDNMRASGDAFASELRAAEVDVDHHVLPGTSHAFLNRPHLRAFDTAVSMMADWMTTTVR